MDQSDLDQWLAEAQGLLWGQPNQSDSEAELARARTTLEKSPDSVEAFLTLADLADSARAALPLLKSAVDAGERALGRSQLAKLVGRFWLDPKTRPYMQARLSLARSLWELSRRDEAVSHLQELLRLNPNDNQGIRYWLANALISLGQFDEARQLIHRYDELSTSWVFSKALIAFHDEGDSPASRHALKSARRANKHVVPFLIGEKEPPEDHPGYYKPGDRFEAVSYLDEAQGAWRQVPGALTWLRSVAATGSRGRRKSDPAKSSHRRRSAAPRATGPTPRAKQRLRKLPLNYGTIWQVTVEQFPQAGDGCFDSETSWMVLGVNLQSGQLIVQDLVPFQPSTALLWDRLIDAMESPIDGPPGRPAEIQVRANDMWQALEPHLQEIEVDVINRPQLDQLEYLVSEVYSHLGLTGEASGLLSHPDVTSTDVGRLYASAAEFYRRRPWHFIPLDAVLRFAGTAVGDRPRYCLVMGQSAMTFGLSVYQSLEHVRSMLDGGCAGCDDECDADDCEADDCGPGECGAGDAGDCEPSEINLAALGKTLAVIFDTPDTLTADDLAAIEKHGWPVAGPEAYPAVYRTSSELTAEPPTAADLRLLAACLIAVPEFASRHPYDADESPCEEFAFDDEGRTLTLAVAWVRDDEVDEVE